MTTSDRRNFYPPPPLYEGSYHADALECISSFCAVLHSAIHMNISQPGDAETTTISATITAKGWGEKEKDSTTARYYYYWVSSSSWSMEAEGARYGDSCAHYTYLLLSVGFCTIWISCRTAASYNNALTSHSLDTSRDVCSCECDE